MTPEDQSHYNTWLSCKEYFTEKISEIDKRLDKLEEKALSSVTNAQIVAVVSVVISIIAAVKSFL